MKLCLVFCFYFSGCLLLWQLLNCQRSVSVLSPFGLWYCTSESFFSVLFLALGCCTWWYFSATSSASTDRALFVSAVKSVGFSGVSEAKVWTLHLDRTAFHCSLHSLLPAFVSSDSIFLTFFTIKHLNYISLFSRHNLKLLNIKHLLTTSLLTFFIILLFLTPLCISFGTLLVVFSNLSFLWSCLLKLWHLSFSGGLCYDLHYKLVLGLSLSVRTSWATKARQGEKGWTDGRCRARRCGCLTS